MIGNIILTEYDKLQLQTERMEHGTTSRVMLEDILKMLALDKRMEQEGYWSSSGWIIPDKLTNEWGQLTDEMRARYVND